MAKNKVEPSSEEAVKKVATKKPAVAKTQIATEKPVKKASAKKVVALETVETTTLERVEPYSRFTDFDVSLFQSGKHYKLYEKFGSHVVEHKGVVGIGARTN